MSQELKIRIDSYEQAKRLLKQAGATRTEEREVTDTYFNQPGKNVLKITEDDTGDYLVALQSTDNGFDIQRYEEINNVEQKKKELVDKHGISCILEKRRIFYELDDYVFNFNLIHDVGDFLVVEGDDLSASIFQDLGFSDPEFITVPFSHLKEEEPPHQAGE